MCSSFLTNFINNTNVHRIIILKAKDVVMFIFSHTEKLVIYSGRRYLHVLYHTVIRITLRDLCVVKVPVVGGVMHLRYVTLFKCSSLVAYTPVSSAPKVKRWRYIVPLLYRFIVHIYRPRQVERLQRKKKERLIESYS